jgi:hypothetical protein
MSPLQRPLYLRAWADSNSSCVEGSPEVGSGRELPILPSLFYLPYSTIPCRPLLFSLMDAEVETLLKC